MCRITWLRPRSPATHPAMHFFQLLGLNRLGTSWHHTDMNLFNPMLHSLKRTWSGDEVAHGGTGDFFAHISYHYPDSWWLPGSLFVRFVLDASTCVYMHIDIQGKWPTPLPCPGLDFAAECNLELDAWIGKMYVIDGWATHPKLCQYRRQGHPPIGIRLALNQGEPVPFATSSWSVKCDDWTELVHLWFEGWPHLAHHINPGIAKKRKPLDFPMIHLSHQFVVSCWTIPIFSLQFTCGLQQFLKSSRLVPSGSDQVKPKAIDPRPLTIDGTMRAACNLVAGDLKHFPAGYQDKVWQNCIK